MCPRIKWYLIYISILQACAELKQVAKQLKLTAEAVDALVRKVVKAQVAGAKAIVKEVRERLEALAKVKCEDVLSADVCVLVKQLAASLKVKAAKVDQVIREIVARGISKVKEVLKVIKERLFPAISDEGRYSSDMNRET